MKYHIFLLITYLCLVGCSKEPTPAQLEIVDRLIQEQIDIPYTEANWNSVKDILSANGETVNEAAERNKKLYTDVHDSLIALKNKPYKEKKIWAVSVLKGQIETFERSLEGLERPDKELVLQTEQWKKWLAILKE